MSDHMPRWKDFGVLVILGAWLVLSLIRQVLNPHWLRRFDVLRLVPGWKLFSGIPLSDCRLYFREFRRNDSHPEWRCILAPCERTLSSAVWHPQRRMRKWLETAAERLTNSRVSSPDSLWVSRAIHGYVEAASPDLLACQFAIELSPEYSRANPIRFVYESQVFQPGPANRDGGQSA